MDEPSAYWMVYRKGGKPPTYEHPTFESAVKEAERIARLSQGSRVDILESVQFRESCDMKRGKFYGSSVPF